MLNSPLPPGPPRAPSWPVCRVWSPRTVKPCGAACGASKTTARVTRWRTSASTPPGWSRDRIVQEINAHGVPCYQGSCSEVYLEKAFDGTGWRPEPRLPVAKALGETSLMWLVHPTLTQAEMARTAEVVGQVLRQASTA